MRASRFSGSILRLWDADQPELGLTCGSHSTKMGDKLRPEVFVDMFNVFNGQDSILNQTRWWTGGIAYGQPFATSIHSASSWACASTTDMDGPDVVRASGSSLCADLPRPQPEACFRMICACWSLPLKSCKSTSIRKTSSAAASFPVPIAGGLGAAERKSPRFRSSAHHAEDAGVSSRMAIRAIDVLRVNRSGQTVATSLVIATASSTDVHLMIETMWGEDFFPCDTPGRSDIAEHRRLVEEAIRVRPG